MTLSKTLGPAFLAGAALLLSACAEEEPLERNTAPTAIDASQALLVLEETGGFAFNDAVLMNIASFGKPNGLEAACKDGGSRTESPGTDADYPLHISFDDCTVKGVAFSGSLDMYDSSDIKRVRLDGLRVSTRYGGGRLALRLYGSMETAYSKIDDDEYYELDIPALALKGNVTRYGRTVPVNLDISDYSRSRRINTVSNEQSLSVIGRLSKSGDYGTYDVEFSNIPTGPGDSLRQVFQGPPAASYTTGTLYIVDRMKAGNWLSITPSDAYPDQEIEQGELVHLKGKVSGRELDVLLNWSVLILPSLVDIFDPS